MNIQSIEIKPKWEAVSQKAKQIPEVTLNPENINLAVKVTRCFKHTANAVKELFGVARHVNLFKGLSLVSIASIPLSILQIASSILEHKISLNEKIDTVFSVIGEIGSLMENTSIISEGLAVIGAVTEKTVTWLAPLGIAGALLGVASIIISTKKVIEVTLFSKKLHQEAALDKKPEEYTLEDYRKGTDLIEERNEKEVTFISKHFDVDKNRLADRLVAVEMEARENLASGDLEKVASSKKKMHHVMQTLAKRITMIKWSQKLVILAEVVGLIGLTVLLASPGAPVGFALLGIGVGIVIVKIVMDKISKSKFEKEMGL